MVTIMNNRSIGVLVILTCIVSGCREQEGSLVTNPPPVASLSSDSNALEILQRYAAAWRGEEEMVLNDTVIVTFNISGPGGGEYHIVVPPGGHARVVEGKAEAFTMGFETDIDFLRRLDRNELNALTAMAQASGEDPIQLRPILPEEFRWTPESRAFYIPFWFHFWNRDWPEIVRFGEGTARSVHGGLATVFYYDKGLRTSWYQLKPGMHINADPEDQVNEFHSLLIVTRGSFQSRLGGHERVLQEGEAVFIPAGMSHEFWVGGEEYGEGILIMFGEGA